MGRGATHLDVQVQRYLLSHDCVRWLKTLWAGTRLWQSLNSETGFREIRGTLRTLKECEPCDGPPNPSPPWMGWDAKQNSYKRNSPESDGDLVNISCTRPLGAECLIFGVTLVFYAQGELAAIIGAIDHFVMRTWTRNTCDTEFAQTGKTVFQCYLGVENFRRFDHKPT